MWVSVCVCPSRFALWAGYRIQLLPDHFQLSYARCTWWEEEPYWCWVTVSKVKVKFGTLCIKPCGHDACHSFYPITWDHSFLSLSCLRTFWVSNIPRYFYFAFQTLKNPTKCIWRWEPDRRSNFFFSPPAHLCVVTYMTEISLIVTLNNIFTSPHLKLYIPRYFCFAPHVSCSWWEEEPYWFWVMWSKVNMGSLCKKTFRHDTDYLLSPIIFKLNL